VSNLQIKMPTVDPTVARLLENCHTKRYANSSRIIHAGDPTRRQPFIT
jgi:hypothetical protein